MLHHTYNDLSSFTNTNSLKVKHEGTDLKFDANKTVLNNELPENEQFKGLTKRWLAENPAVLAFYQKTEKDEQS
jgi:hypothetical protein